MQRDLFSAHGFPNLFFSFIVAAHNLSDPND